MTTSESVCTPLTEQDPTIYGHAVLVYPPTGIDVPGTSIFLPLSVILPAALLRRHGCDVSIVDMRVEPDWAGRLDRELARGPLFVGFRL